ncbi:unnamed protein product [Symbiodinium sp. CCMP2456]|nr:unnamed protein product [Symbiodinium sp. CCMP2456]
MTARSIGSTSRSSWLKSIVMLLLIWHNAFAVFFPRCTLGFAAPAGRGQMPRRSLPEFVSAAFDIAQDPSVQAAWGLVVTSLDGLKSAADLSEAFGQVLKLSNTWEQQALFEGNDLPEHVSRLTKDIEERLQKGQNVLIPGAQDGELPAQPVRGTPFEKLMTAVLQNSRLIGTFAVYAEPGAGKSTAATLAALELSERLPTDLIVLLQNNYDLQLKRFFRLSNVEFTAEVARALFASLRQKGIRLRLMFDNVLDSAMGRQDEDTTRVLARAAAEHAHQVVFLVQSENSAAAIAGLNGDTTSIPPQQTRAAAAYRWSREETLDLLQGLGLSKEADEILEQSQIPDEFGGWRPRSTKIYIQTRRKPTAPRPAPGTGASSAPSTIVWVRELIRKDTQEYTLSGANAFKIKEAVTDVDDLKEAIEKKEKLRIAASKILIFSRQEDGEWRQEEEDAAVNRGATKSDSYGFVLPDASQPPS